MTRVPVYRITVSYALGAPNAIRRHHSVGEELVKQYLNDMDWHCVIKVEINVQGV